MDLKDRLISQPPRDTSGATSADRFVYQQHWALCELLRLHLQQTDYVIIFDHHEDVSVLDSESAPTELRAYQIKTKSSGNWTITSLIKQKLGSGTDPKPLDSILGKLYKLEASFPGDVVLLQFVSNAPVTVKLGESTQPCRDSKKTKFDDLHKDERSKIAESLKKECELKDNPKLSSLLEFVVAELPLNGHATFVKGKIAEFVEELLPGKAVRLDALYKALLSEVTVRNNNNEQPSSFEDLLSKKALSRTKFTSVLTTAGVTKTAVELSSVISRLNSERAPMALIKTVESHWDQVAVDRLLRGERSSLIMWEKIQEACRSVSEVPSLADQIEKAHSMVHASLLAAFPITENYIKTCIAMVAYEC